MARQPRCEPTELQTAMTAERYRSMDDIVLKSIAKWPNVPDVFGWLELDRRGTWLIKGERIGNPLVTEFIGRNYHVDERGRWFFQNGPQRVFVTLAYAPFVLRTRTSPHAHSLETHTGIELDTVTGAWLDEEGTLVVRWSATGIGSMCDRDLAEITAWLTDASGRRPSDDAMTRALESRAAHGSTGIWLSYRSRRLPVGRVLAEQLPRKFGFERSPLPAPGQPEC